MIEKIVQGMKLEEAEAEIQRIQTAHRLKLIDFWNIAIGTNVLEIGCGQGDTTAALAYTVGKEGFVHGIDIAQESYGLPMTLGEARQKLLDSEIGSNIRMDFNFNILADTVSFENESFDYIVLSKCSWYFSSYEELVAILKRVRPWGKKLCFAEWSTNVKIPEQLAHYNAIMIQALCESYKTISTSNVRTLFTPNKIKKAMSEAGWKVARDTEIYSPDLQDGVWEVNMTRSIYPKEIENITDIPQKLKDLLLSQIEELSSVNKIAEIRPLSVYVVQAE
ncbi:class I SAM-dependent methyltransferase [Neobacillus sp. PS3-40]|uniref:class I SAM-dependent methyltransferase n=1 Tax=Neobacillus sp. PS3-40 TaxID=3070679 RepID=UPI0027E09488|nr:class I SAM-dependent methyltransferase [Neobacillus sp. PS3-40]WML44692.1 class I SAM-dependent methyltransferase [Neobacillus sp. PS3-40]